MELNKARRYFAFHVPRIFLQVQYSGKEDTATLQVAAELTAPLPINLIGCLCPCLVPPQLPKSCYSICHIECLRPVHGALNVDEKKLITQFGGKLRDERFEPN